MDLQPKDGAGSRAANATAAASRRTPKVEVLLEVEDYEFCGSFLLKIVGAPTLCTPNPNECDA
jgi:hypothetical protein